MVRRLTGTIACAFALLLFSSEAGGQVHIGTQIGVGTDSGLGLGTRLVFPLRAGALGVDGALDGTWFFGGGSAVRRWIDTNLNVRVPVPLAPDFTTRIGAGVNFTFLSFDDLPSPAGATESEIGLNLLANIGLPQGNLAPFVELRLIVGGAEQLVLTGGFTVGPRR